MADFSNLAITNKGRMLLADVQAGGIFDATRLVMGSGAVPVGKTPATMTDVVAPVISIEVNSKEKTPDGKVIFGGYYSNADVTEEFYFKEFALYARAIYRNADGDIIQTGDEVLYSYGNAGNTADLIPAYTTGTVVEKQLEMISYVGSETEVNLTIESDIYTPKREFDSHKARHSKGGADAITPLDIGASPEGHTHTPESIGAAPTAHTHSLAELNAAAANHTHTPESIGAAPANHSHSLASLGAAPAHTWGTTDIVAGSPSSEPNGTLHLVIE